METRLQDGLFLPPYVLGLKAHAIVPSQIMFSKLLLLASEFDPASHRALVCDPK